MDLTLFRRHGHGCKPGQKYGRGHTACQCMIWCDGTENGKRVLRSMGTRDWGRAEARLRILGRDPSAEVAKAALSQTPGSQLETISVAAERFLKDCVRRNISEGTIRNYRSVLESFIAHCEKHGEEAITEVSIHTVRDFHLEPRVHQRPVKGTHGEQLQTITRLVQPSTARKELETLRTFFNWLIDGGSLAVSPAKKVKPPVMSEDEDADADPRPFSQSEIELIFMAADELQNNNQGSVKKARRRAKAIVYVMLYSGLRISDVAAFARASINLQDRRFKVRTIKSRYKTIVRGKLPPAAREALAALPVESPYFFCTGTGKPSTTRGSIRRTIGAIMRVAGIGDGNPHRFRHTFATRLFQKGARVEQVAMALGHSDPRVTIKHYKHWIPAIQEQAEALTDQLDFDGTSVSSPRVLGDESVKNRNRNSDRSVVPFPSRTA
jgi:site-specific recombinase XerD